MVISTIDFIHNVSYNNNMTINLFKARRKYLDHKGNATKRGVMFEQWLKIWIDSGHWLDRGPKKGQYCMSRFNDIGSYAIGNVFIQPTFQNTIDAQKGTPKTRSLCIHCGKSISVQHLSRHHCESIALDPSGSTDG